MAGTLYIVSGPIGNMKDITLRALETLQAVDIILSEDTRETVKILDKYNIKASQLSYRDQNHSRVFPDILALLEAGKSAALISDSGTPAISDPGFKLVRELRARNISVVPIPGPSAAVAALSVSGFPTDKFIFIGYLPKKRTDLEKTLLTLPGYKSLVKTVIAYESPHRLIASLKQIHGNLGDIQVVVAREITKMYETYYSGKITDVLGKIGQKVKGEVTLLLCIDDKS